MRFRSCVSEGVEAVPDRSGIGVNERMVVGVACFVLVLSASAQGQFFKVYPYKTADAGAVEVSYWTTFISSSDGQDRSESNPSVVREAGCREGPLLGRSLTMAAVTASKTPRHSAMAGPTEKSR